MRDGFVFYRSFFECFDGLSKKDKLTLFDALCNYALNDVEPELTGVPSAIFVLLKPQVDANNRRYENGCKGGRPKGTELKPNNNQTETKPKPKEQVQVQDKEKVQVQLQPQAPASGRGGSDCDDKFNIWKLLDSEGIDKIYDAYPESGGYLLDEVYKYVRDNRRVIKNPVGYVLGYAKKVGWDDNAEHFDGGGMS